jgi:hypothetical protein
MRSSADIEFASLLVPNTASPHFCDINHLQCPINRSGSGDRSGLNGVTTGASTPRMRSFIWFFRSCTNHSPDTLYHSVLVIMPVRSFRFFTDARDGEDTFNNKEVNASHETAGPCRNKTTRPGSDRSTADDAGEKARNDYLLPLRRQTDRRNHFSLEPGGLRRLVAIHGRRPQPRRPRLHWRKMRNPTNYRSSANADQTAMEAADLCPPCRA